MSSNQTNWNVQTAGREWSYKTVNGAQRFEVRSGDHWSGDGVAPKERAEAYVPDIKFTANETYNISFSMMIEPGARNTAAWMTLLQIQSTFDKGEVGHSPPFAIEMAGERMRIVTRADDKAISGASDGGYSRLYNDAQDIVRGQWYDFNIQIQFDPFGNGTLMVTRNGIVLVDYEGALGFNDLVGGYLKEGVYRGEAAETFAVQYKTVAISEVETGPNKVTGTAAADKLVGTAGDDILLGGAGKDVIDGGAGNDIADYRDKTTAIEVVLSGSGDTQVKVGGLIEDTLRNVESVYGGSDADKLTGSQFDNQLFGFGGDDTLKGGEGKDVLNGGDGVDTVDYSYASKAVSITLDANGNAVVKVGGVEEDQLYAIENIIGGGKGDLLVGNAGANFLNGGPGDDILTGGGGADVLEGSGGIDTATYVEKTEGVAVALSNNIVVQLTVGGKPEDRLSNIENIDGGQGNDTLVGDSKANTFRGFGGNDVLSGGLGNDALDGGAGNDRLDGGEGDDVLIGGGGADVLSGGRGNDVFVFFSVEDSTLQAIDKITDFARGDRIDLSKIDANTKAAGDQAFVLASGFTGVAGQLVLTYKDGVSTVSGDVNGDRLADLHFQVNGNITSLVVEGFTL
jgi:Ca2+-binding RTX toxin-like protein